MSDHHDLSQYLFDVPDVGIVSYDNATFRYCEELRVLWPDGQEIVTGRPWAVRVGQEVQATFRTGAGTTVCTIRRVK